MRWLLGLCAIAGTVLAAPVDEFLGTARERHGDAGARAAQFLVDHMPPGDRESLTAAFLIENLDLALQARHEFPWASTVPEDLFLNDVLPYAVFNEPRDPWRPQLMALARELVQGSKTAAEAAQALNRQLFDRIQVHYHTGRKRPHQSLRESMELGKATCTGLSIILVEACRSVGIPARAVGTPLWANGRGNHTWVEIWDGDWQFTGADEYDAAGLNRGWFVGDAAEAIADQPRHAIYATSWKREGLTFPMVWSRGSESVAAVNVTERYAASRQPPAPAARLGVRLWDCPGGERIAAKVCVLDGVRRSCALDSTRSGTADLNDMPRFHLQPGDQGWLRFTVGEEAREMPFGPLPEGNPTVDAIWPDLTPATAAVDAARTWLEHPVGSRPANAPELDLPLTKVEAERVTSLVATDLLNRLAVERREEVEQRTLTFGDQTLRWTEHTFGDAPAGGRSLWISMHGGGNAPPEVNDRQWQNQGRLYEPAEGIYVAPRAPTDTWNLWHESHIDPLFQRLIDNYVAVRGVDPNRVYLMGYSAGGDGVWQLAPRMADRFAAAAMMAGHPNEASLLGLRNLPFALFMGAEDRAYNRNQVARDRAAELDRLQQEDPAGYVHLTRIYEGLGHWMQKKDAEALPWMAAHQRQPWPRRIVWFQDDVVHRRFYWLQVAADAPVSAGHKIVAVVDGQTVRLEGDVPDGIRLRLSDHLLDLDQPVRVWINGQERFSGTVPRTTSAIVASLTERADAASASTASLALP